VRIYLHEDLDSDSLGVMRDLYAFLGVDESFVPDVRRRYNPSGLPRYRSLQGFLTSSTVARRLARTVVPATHRKRMYDAVFQRNLRRPPLDERLRGELVAGFRDDVEALQGLIGRDLSSWLR